MVHVGLLSGVHWERAKGHATHADATQLLQAGKGIDYRKDVIEVPEGDVIDVDAIEGSECREKAWEARMKREVF